nr:immunoglobulin light chain junction region [Macaca mulatta]MOV72272.1 immunoglobulin light chain junction region [Macaca mulatta]MOV72288.1 immunoglobulin light chain junction region [Macaca mulatta]MOV72290.1 immunoglobulin light chain junction region [Macaca mulatta]MOV72350.1 immunoglobulin light chain junction region [Macaca mulatta]
DYYCGAWDSSLSARLF